MAMIGTWMKGIGGDILLPTLTKMVKQKTCWLLLVKEGNELALLILRCT